jgi:histidinol dehydrogenase
LSGADIRIEDFSGIGPDSIEGLIHKSTNGFPSNIEKQVLNIIRDIAKRKDRALIDYTKQFDDYDLEVDALKVPMEEIRESGTGFDKKLERALEISIERVRRFHKHHIPQDWTYTDEHGNEIGQLYRPIERVGVYIPGGKATYPSSLIMTAVPAMVAGVDQVVVVSPPSSFEKPSALCAALIAAGFTDEVYRIGGAHAIAALALGTESIRRVDKIVGPGNMYVALAKKSLFGYVDIDMIAGPSEILIITDGSVHPGITAIDLLAQAEHDEDARVSCVSRTLEHAHEVQKWVRKLTRESPRKDIIQKSITNNGRIFVVDDDDCAARIVNVLAPEHLEIQIEDPQAILPKIKNAGAIFIGKYSAEAYGDYVAGPSHVLPTGGTSRFFSPLNTASFFKVSSIVRMSKRGMESLGLHASLIAQIEGLSAHADSIKFRKDKRF